ncbi:MAG: hypothetical protein BA873_11295 [Desulfobulbaceae bacterium C00003063]|nr:MAG: hypothetical protein BA873_11295 [Desulfobulbaceae bacterium C00003063]
MNIQAGHVDIFVMVPAKVSISGFVGTVKGRATICVLNNNRKLTSKPYWGNHFGTKKMMIREIDQLGQLILTPFGGKAE